MAVSWQGGAAKGPQLLEDVAVFSAVPRAVGLTIEPPAGSCTISPSQFRLDGAWVLREADIGICSELVVHVEGLDASRDEPADLVLRAVEGDPGIGGRGGRALGRAHVDGADPVFFRSLRPGPYVIEGISKSRGISLADIVTVPAEASYDYDLHVAAIAVHGKVRFRDREASGVLRFVREGESRKREIKAPIGESGQYSARLPEPGYYVLNLLSTPNDQDGPQRSITVPDSPDTSLDIDFTNGSVHGVVLDQESRPIEGVRVISLVRQDGEESSTWVFTSSDGSYSFENLITGSCELNATKPGYEMDGPPPSFRVADRDALTVDLVLKRSRSAIVTVVSPVGMPVRGAEVYCAPMSEPITWNLLGLTDERGVTDIAVEEGEPLLCGVPNPGGPIGQFHLTNPEPVTWTLRSGGGGLLVSLADQNGAPVPNKEVLLRANGELVAPLALWRHVSARGGSTFSDVNGTARLDDLPSGWLELYLSGGESDIAAISKAASGSAEGRAAEFDLEPGDQRIVTITVRRVLAGR